MKLKAQIIALFIRKNGLFDRERLCFIHDRGIFKHLILKTYRNFLKIARVPFAPKIKQKDFSDIWLNLSKIKKSRKFWSKF